MMIAGPRMSGKTTLTRTLLGFDSVKLVGDDVICLLDDCVVGLGTPLLLRSGKDIVDGERFITIDDEGRERFLFHANASRLPTRWPNYLVFPQYNADCPPEICPMSPGDVFRNLMQNIRHHNTIQRLKEDVLRLANTPAYSIKYPSQQAAMMLLRQKNPMHEESVDMNNKKSQMRSRFENFGYALQLTWRFYPQKLICTIVLTVLKGVISFFSLQYMLRYVINGATNGVPFRSLSAFMLLMLGANILFKCIDAAYSTLVNPLISRLSEARLEKQIMNKLLGIDIANYEDPEAYDLAMRAASMGQASIDGVLEVVGEMLAALVQLVLSVFLIIEIDPWLLIFPVIPLLLNPLNLKIDRLYIEMMRKQQGVTRKKDYVSRIFYQKEYACDMRMTSMPRVMLREFKSAVERCQKLRVVYGRKLAALFFVLAFITNASVLLAMIYAVYHTLVSHTMLLGDCLIVLNMFGDVADNIQNMARMFSWIDETALHVEDYRAFMEKQQTIVAEGTPKPVPALADIHVSDASFAYDGSKVNVITDMNLDIRKGEKIALVGENGAGKTTLVKLLLRLYDVQAGSVNVSGTNIRRYDPRQYRERFAVVLQEHPLLAVSIADNVLGRRCTPDDTFRVREALEKVGLWEAVSQLPRGIDTPLTREFSVEGANFSVGQQQLLSIAGIYARDCDVIVLDEPSSALDPIAERDMYETMLKACQGKTVIFITHRLSSVQDADRILLCEHGTILEEGTHAQLMARNGKYARMFSAQAAAYRL